MRRIYFDYAATTPIDLEVIKTMSQYYTKTFGNPSSIHYFGRKALYGIEKSRQIISSFINAELDEIVFTSGGTESNNYALKGIIYANRNRGNHLITSAIEHHSIIEPCKYLQRQGIKVTYLKVDKYGLVDPQDVKKAITNKTVLISIMYANNEIGVIQPIKEIGRIARDKGVYFHTDAVQSFGHLPTAVDELNVDLLSASSHKLYGPKGVGMLYIRKGMRIMSFMHGGDQENGRRASTYNVPGIVGFGKAVELARDKMGDERRKLTSLRDKLIDGILNNIEQTRLNGHPFTRLPNNVNVSVGSVEGEALVLNLDMEGIACSTGSACTSSSLEPSHVLLALGLSPELAHGSLRFTLGRYTKDEEIDYTLDVLRRIVNKLRSMSPLYKGRG